MSIVKEQLVRRRIEDKKIWKLEFAIFAEKYCLVLEIKRGVSWVFGACVGK